MILIDTSIWIDHFRAPEKRVISILDDGKLLAHPFIIGEIMLGNMRGRERIADLLGRIPQAIVANADEMLAFISLNRLGGRGIGYVDAHLLAAARLTPDTQLWSRDKRLAATARELGVGYAE